MAAPADEAVVAAPSQPEPDSRTAAAPAPSPGPDQLSSLDAPEQVPGPSSGMRASASASPSAPSIDAPSPAPTQTTSPMLVVPLQKVGSIIGRRGEFVKKMCEDTRSRIKILEGIPGSDVRVVLVSAREDPEAALNAAMDGLLRVHRRVLLDGVVTAEADGASTGSGGMGPDATSFLQQLPAGAVTTRLLVPATQAGSLIGRMGATIKNMQDESGASIRVLPAGASSALQPAYPSCGSVGHISLRMLLLAFSDHAGSPLDQLADEVPPGSLSDDRLVEVTGEARAVHLAVHLISSQLRRFLVDRSVLTLFEHSPRPQQLQYPMPVGHTVHGYGGASGGAGPPSYAHHPPYQPTYQEPLPMAHYAHDHHGRLAATPDPYSAAHAHSGQDTYGAAPALAATSAYPGYEYEPAAQQQQQAPSYTSAVYGQEPVKALTTSVAPLAAVSNVISQVSQHMQIPLAYADAIIGAGGANILYLRQTSGATVTIQETRSATGEPEMTVEIKGSTSQVHSAQQLIEGFMASGYQAAASAAVAAPASATAQGPEAAAALPSAGLSSSGLMQYVPEAYGQYMVASRAGQYAMSPGQQQQAVPQEQQSQLLQYDGQPVQAYLQ
eukprot:SM000234S07881  [mRNA]  locus=s234:7580:10861:+ [translate_table: standard]